MSKFSASEHFPEKNNVFFSHLDSYQGRPKRTFGQLSGLEDDCEFLSECQESGYPWLRLDIRRLGASNELYEKIYKEAKAVEPLAVEYDKENSRGWKSLAVHGISPSHVQSCDKYGYESDNDVPYVWTEIAQLCPATKELLENHYPFSKYHRVRFMYLEPGGYIDPHKDGDEERGHHLVAVNLALNHPEECSMYLEEGGLVPFSDPGDCFWLSLTRRHSVINKSNETRIHLIAHGTKAKSQFAKALRGGLPTTNQELPNIYFLNTDGHGPKQVRHWFLKKPTVRSPEVKYRINQPESARLDQPIDCLVSVGSGVLPYSIIKECGYRPEAQIIYVDINRRLLNLRQSWEEHLLNNKTFHLSQWAQNQGLDKESSSLLFNLRNRWVPLKDLSTDLMMERFLLELERFELSIDDVKKILELKKEYVVEDFVRLGEKLLSKIPEDPNKAVAIYFSNMFDWQGGIEPQHVFDDWAYRIWKRNPNVRFMGSMGTGRLNVWSLQEALHRAHKRAEQ